VRTSEQGTRGSPPRDRDARPVVAAGAADESHPRGGTPLLAHFPPMSALELSYGPRVPNETDLRLCGAVDGRRVVELGCATPANAVAFARAGARVLAVDPDVDTVGGVRRAAEDAEVRVECHVQDLADLGFATSASVDLVFSAMALATVTDLDRVFRQAHRVLKPGAPLVFSVPHPISSMLQGGEVVLRTPYGAGARTVGQLFTALTRANFQVDAMLEPLPTEDRGAMVPAALVLRGRKLGV
jgi:SAM-dependent methyltransferase